MGFYNLRAYDAVFNLLWFGSKVTSSCYEKLFIDPNIYIYVVYCLLNSILFLFTFKYLHNPDLGRAENQNAKPSKD